MAEAEAGSLDALGELRNTNGLSEAAVLRLVEQLSRLVNHQIDDAHTGRYDHGGLDCGRTLALLNVWHPDQADWHSLMRLLSDQTVAVEHKQGTVGALAALVDRLPETVHAELTPIALSLAETPPSALRRLLGPNQSIGGVAVHLAVALGAYDEEETSEQLLKLLAGTNDERLWIVGIAGRKGRPEHIGLLAALCHAPEPDLRANAAAALAVMAATGNGGTLALAALRRCLTDPGTRLPRLVAKALAKAPSLTPAAQGILTKLQSHPSALVRRTAAQAIPGTI